MEPMTMIVLALAAGAAAGLKPTAEQMVKDAYAGVKRYIQSKYTNVDLTPLERKPDSEIKRESVKEDLKDAGAEHDKELLERIDILLKALEQKAPETAQIIGVDLKTVRTAYIKINKVQSEGTGVRMDDVTTTGGGIDIGEVEARKGKKPGNP